MSQLKVSIDDKGVSFAFLPDGDRQNGPTRLSTVFLSTLPWNYLIQGETYALGTGVYVEGSPLRSNDGVPSIAKTHIGWIVSIMCNSLLEPSERPRERRIICGKPQRSRSRSHHEYARLIQGKNPWRKTRPVEVSSLSTWASVLAHWPFDFFCYQFWECFKAKSGKILGGGIIESPVSKIILMRIIIHTEWNRN